MVVTEVQHTPIANKVAITYLLDGKRQLIIASVDPDYCTLKYDLRSLTRNNPEITEQQFILFMKDIFRNKQPGVQDYFYRHIGIWSGEISKKKLSIQRQPATPIPPPRQIHSPI